MVHVPDLIRDKLIVPDGYRFALLYRQEYSRQANGISIPKDMGRPIWTMDATTKPMPHDEALAFEAKMETLDGGLGTFNAWDVRKPYPSAYRNGDFADTGKIATIASNRKALSLYNLPGSFALSVGDYLSFQGYGWASLHRIVQAVTANGSGVTTQFEIRPHLWFTVDVDTPVVLKKAFTVMSIIPGSITPSQNDALHSVVTFQAYQVPYSGS